MTTERKGIPDVHLIETTLSSEAVFDGALLHVRRDVVRLPGGGSAKREYIVHPGAVLMIPVLADGRLIVERQFRYPLNRVFTEFPAGKLSPGEDALATAKRELIEETGYTATTWTWLGRIHPVIGYSNETIEFYVAEGLTHVGAQLDEGEFLDIIIVSLDEMLAMLDRGEISDGKTVSSLLLYARQRSLRR